MTFFKEELKKVKAFVFDVDGVLSLPSVSVDENGELIRTACVKDGYAIMYSGKKGYIRAIISGGGGPGVRERFEKIGNLFMVLLGEYANFGGRLEINRVK